ncbi:trypsin CFT-1 [Plutella xylostella]|uniref:trypsin CFT-1 n=1 Tax=Plutella xylostella TaxID=51655 RepID=UPI002032453B|nr:trypsin CFT-1 [Plutella xylostella]
MHSAIISLAVISVALAASVPAPAQQRIVGGRPTTVDKYPFAGNIQSDLFGVVTSSVCGGSLISATAVLTAAHCVGFPASAYGVRLGSAYANSGGTVYNVASYVVHPDWTYVDEGDVAILKLARPVIFSDVVRAARIPASIYPIADGTELTAIGWGILYPGGPGPESLQEVQLKKINTSICAERYRDLNAQLDPSLHYPDVTDRMLCSGIDAGGKSTCSGDSGGPIIVNDDIVVGVISWVDRNCGAPLYPGVNSLVSAYSDWIVENAS